MNNDLCRGDCTYILQSWARLTTNVPLVRRCVPLGATWLYYIPYTSLSHLLHVAIIPEIPYIHIHIYVYNLCGLSFFEGGGHSRFFRVTIILYHHRARRIRTKRELARDARNRCAVICMRQRKRASHWQRCR